MGWVPVSVLVLVIGVSGGATVGAGAVVGTGTLVGVGVIERLSAPLVVSFFFSAASQLSNALPFMALS